MTTWHDDRHCPDWCVNGAEHLGWSLTRSGDFWHRGSVERVVRADLDHNWNPRATSVQTIQREQVDVTRGHHRHPATVDVEGGEFTPQNARALATAILRAADVAEAAMHDAT